MSLYAPLFERHCSSLQIAYLLNNRSLLYLFFHWNQHSVNKSTINSRTNALVVVKGGMQDYYIVVYDFELYHYFAN